MKPPQVTQITHDDLDGYGCSTVVGRLVVVSRVEHVTCYADVEAVLRDEIDRLEASDEPRVLIVTDIAIEGGFADAMVRLARLNAFRDRPHTMLAIDHHASSGPVLLDRGFQGHAGTPLAATGAPRENAMTYLPGDAGRHGATVSVILDTARSATGLCWDHRQVLSGLGAAPAGTVPTGNLEALVDAVDAVDLWRRERPAFEAGESINAIFWECVRTYLPAGHGHHDAFMSRILLELASRVRDGASAAEVEAHGGIARGWAVDWLVGVSGLSETEEDRGRSSRMRVSRLLAASNGMFADPMPGVRLCHAADPGVFQRVSDFMLEDPALTCLVNVMRGGAMSFRSRNGEAIAMAHRFGGGGHVNAAGARLGTDAVFSLEQATRLFLAVMRSDTVPSAPSWNA